MKVAIYNHINDTWNQFNVDEKHQHCIVDPITQIPSQGYINLLSLIRTVENIANILYANSGDHFQILKSII